MSVTELRSRTQVLMNGKTISEAIKTMASQILVSHPTLEKVALVGILHQGYPLAQRLARCLQQLSGQEAPPVGRLDISLYRDDLHQRGDYVTIEKSEILFGVTNTQLILVDDVLFQGRTVRAGLNALLDFGRPERIELAVLIDRGHRRIPVTPNYVGKTIKTKESDHVSVRLYEIDGDDEVTLEKDAH